MNTYFIYKLVNPEIKLPYFLNNPESTDYELLLKAQENRDYGKQVTLALLQAGSIIVMYFKLTYFMQLTKPLG